MVSPEGKVGSFDVFTTAAVRGRNQGVRQQGGEGAAVSAVLLST